MSKVETRFDTKTALAVANAIYCKKGYVKTTEADYGDRKSNKTLVLEELAKENPKYAKKDVSVANEIIEHYQGLLIRCNEEARLDKYTNSFIQIHNVSKNIYSPKMYPSQRIVKPNDTILSCTHV